MEKITPCAACYGCRKSGRCFYSMDAQMKIMIDRCLPRYQEIRNKDFYYIITAADPEHSAADETIAGLHGYLRCLPRGKPSY